MKDIKGNRSALNDEEHGLHGLQLVECALDPRAGAVCNQLRGGRVSHILELEIQTYSLKGEIITVNYSQRQDLNMYYLTTYNLLTYKLYSNKILIKYQSNYSQSFGQAGKQTERAVQAGFICRPKRDFC